MKIGTFYKVLIYAFENGEISSISEGMQELRKAGIFYYEVFADDLKTEKDEEVLLTALKETESRIGNLYFKKDIDVLDEKTTNELLEYTKERIEQCVRLHCKKLMPVITVANEDDSTSKIAHDYYKTVSEWSDQNGIKTVFENNTNSRTQSFTLKDVENLMDNSDKLTYLLDTGNYWFSKENTFTAIHDFKERIGRVHLKDILPEDGSTPGSENIKVSYTTLGEGVSSIKECIKNLEKIGYDKGFTIELSRSNPVLPRVYKSIETITKAESELQLVYVAQQYYDLLLLYAREYEEIGEEIELKTLHMLSVASLMNTLALKLGCDKHMHQLAIITGLFHDVGRYEQFKQYHTFRDSISTDHANLSAEIAEKEGFFHGLSSDDQKMVLTAIRNHNKYQIEEGLDEKTLLLCKMIRDADKIDCFRVVSSEPYENSYAVTREELEESLISEKVFESIRKHEMVVNTDRKYPLDYILSCCAFVFDINFPVSKKIILEKKKYLCGLDKLSYKNPETAEKFGQIFKEIDDYLND